MVQSVEAIRESFKKKYALKFQLIINNYGFMHERLQSESLQTLFALATEDSLVAQVKESLDFHVEQFSQYVWKETRSVLKRLFAKSGGLVENFPELSEVCQFLIELVGPARRA